MSQNKSMTIPDEAIQAATDVFPWQAADYTDAETIRAALEAALPYLLEAARKDGAL